MSYLLVISKLEKLESLLPENITSPLFGTMWKLISKAVTSVLLPNQSDISLIMSFNYCQFRLLN